MVNQKDARKRLNPKTVKNIHGGVHSALHQAVRIGYLKTNPASLAILPKRSKTEIASLQDEQATQFLQAIKGHPFDRIYLVDLFTGIRQSEILGLKWEDVDFERRQITIRRQLQFLGHKYGGYRFTTPKNNKTPQIIPATFVMDVLRRQRIRQMEQRLAAGSAWKNADDLVFTDELGHHLKHDLIYRHLKRIFKNMGFLN